jgi:hypothetical protein
MAEDTKYIDNEPVSIYLYVSKDTETVDAIFTFNVVAMAIRRNNAWDVVTRKDPEFDQYINTEDYDVWKVDWSKGPIIDADPSDESAWDHQLVQSWDKDEKLTSSELEKYANKVEVVIEEPNQEN